MDGHEQRKHGSGNRRMGHDMGQGRSHNKAAEIDHTGFFADNGEHLVGNTFGKPCLGENHTNDNGTKDKENGRIHEILECHLRITNHKECLEKTDSETGDTNRHHLKNPPCCCQCKNGQGTFGLCA